MSFTSTDWPKNVALLVPAYNAADSLKKFLPELLNKVPADQVCVVNDGSTDSTVPLCNRLNIECISHSKNKGKGIALATGFTQLINDFDWIITMDADGQHSVDDLPNFLEAIEKKSNTDTGILIGSRNRKNGVMPLDRIISNTITSGIISFLCKARIEDSQCGYRAYSSMFIKSITIECPRFEMETEVILKASYNNVGIGNIKVQTLYFQTQSHISHLKDTLRWIKAVTGIFLTLRIWLKMKRDRADHA